MSNHESERLKSLRQKQEHFQLLIENLQSDICDLKLSVDQANTDKLELRNKFEEDILKMTKQFHEEKLEMKEFYLCQLETQRLEMREEIRKILSFKDVSNKVNDDGEPKKSFKDSKEKLFHKIQRLSARMSMQDLDMKEMQEVKSWNEKKLETELHRLQDSVKKPAAGDRCDRSRISNDNRLSWTTKQGELDQQLEKAASCGNIADTVFTE